MVLDEVNAMTVAELDRHVALLEPSAYADIAQNLASGMDTLSVIKSARHALKLDLPRAMFFVYAVRRYEELTSGERGHINALLVAYLGGGTIIATLLAAIVYMLILAFGGHS